MPFTCTVTPGIGDLSVAEVTVPLIGIVCAHSELMKRKNISNRKLVFRIKIGVWLVDNYLSGEIVILTGAISILIPVTVYLSFPPGLSVKKPVLSGVLLRVTRNPDSFSVKLIF